MSQFTVSVIKKDVRNILAENENIEPLLQDSGILDDQLATERDTLIEHLICKAIDRIHVAAPINMVRDVSKSAITQSSTIEFGPIQTLALEIGTNNSNVANQLNQTTAWDNTDEYCKKLPLPKDFLRLTFVRLKSWREAVYTLTDQDSAEYAQARSPFSIMRPNTRHPMVSIVVDDETNNRAILECYPIYVKENKKQDGSSYVPKQYDETGCSCYYIPKSSISSDNKVNIAEECYYAVIYMIANLYFVSINEAEKAKAMADEVADILNGKVIINK